MLEVAEREEIKQQGENFISKSTIVDYVDKKVDKSGFTVRIPADKDMLNQLIEYMKFAEIPYEVMK